MFKKLKNRWNGLSHPTGNALIAVASLAAGVLLCAPVFVAIGAIFPFAAISFAAAFAGVGIAAVVAGLVFNAPLRDLVKAIRQDNKQVTWKNAAGQTLKSTAGQKEDLKTVQEYIQHCSTDNGAGISRGNVDKALSAAREFKAVAEKVTIVEDIRNGNGKFHLDPPLAYK